MTTNTEKLFQSGCNTEDKYKVCRSRGGESCAFDGAMIVLQPIADAAHIVHGPIACCGNSWEGRGSLSKVGAYGHPPLHRMGFTTDMNEMDIIYGSYQKLYDAIFHAYNAVSPKAVFVYATCVSGLIGEDIESVCRSAEKNLGIPVIPVNAPGFVGPKNLGNRIAGEALLDYVIGTAEPSFTTDSDINLIGEYNIAGDLWLIEPVLRDSGVRVLSRITGEATFEEIRYAHRAKLNVVVCSRALINIAKEMEKRYGIPYIEVSFFGKTEMSKAIRKISEKLKVKSEKLQEIEKIIKAEETSLELKLRAYSHLKGKKAVLYTGGVKSWSFISALHDLGIEVAAVGTKKSTVEDEEKMKAIMGNDAPLIEDTTPKNLLRLLREKHADILVAGGRNQYLGVKEGVPFVDVNQERHTAYAGYQGLVNLAEQISNGIQFYAKSRQDSAESALPCVRKSGMPQSDTVLCVSSHAQSKRKDIVINPLKHSQSIGATIAFQGIHNAIPVIHGAQGCSFLAKVLLTKHFREPIALASTKLFTEDIVMGSEENMARVVKGFAEKNKPEVIGVLSSGLSEAKGDDLEGSIRQFRNDYADCEILHISIPDYEGGLESGYTKAVSSIIGIAGHNRYEMRAHENRLNVLAGSHLSPADVTELREIIESFGLVPLILPDLSALDGSRQGLSPLAVGGTKVNDIRSMGRSAFTIAIGLHMEPPAKQLGERFGIEYKVFESISGLKDVDMLMETLSMLSGNPLPPRYERQRRILIDGMRDAHFYFGCKRICLALEPDLSVQTSKWIGEMGATVSLAVIPTSARSAERIRAENVLTGDLFSIEGMFDLMISGSHAEDTAKRLGVPLYQMGFPVYKVLGNTAKVAIGYRGTLALINDTANLLIKEVHA
jgi:nitrogenase molybdenum-cofactor synthesis protein NifE